MGKHHNSTNADIRTSSSITGEISLKTKKTIFIQHIFYSSAKENSLSAQSTTPAQTQRAKFSRVVMPIRYFSVIKPRILLVPSRHHHMKYFVFTFIC